MADFNTCANCGGEVTSDSDFCPHCGVLFERAGDVLCETHLQRASRGICIICRKLVCEECSKVIHGRMFCLDHSRIEVQQDWAKIFQSTEINESELVKSVLESAEVHVQVQNFNSIGFVWDGGGDSPQSRSNISKPAKVFVPIPEYLRAAEILEEWQSAAKNK